MLHVMPGKCPVCQNRFTVTRLGCDSCESVLEGNFEPGRLAGLPAETQQFIVMFLKCRGNIREMEKIYNISYPTVRSRIDEIVTLLGESAQTEITQDEAESREIEKSAPARLEILTMLARGETTLDKAYQLLGTQNTEIKD